MENTDYIARNKRALAVVWRKAEDLDIDSWLKLARLAMPIEAAAAEDPEKKAIESAARQPFLLDQI